MHRLHGALTLPSGARLRLRLPQRADRALLEELLERLGLEADGEQLAHALRVDPRERVAAVATRLGRRGEQIVGFGVMDRYARDPDLVLADERTAPGVGAGLETALRARRID